MSQELHDISKVVQPRDYICPCGKSYLSYPALFTHIKQKHGGKAPGQIIKPKPSGRGRGRPPKRDLKLESKGKDTLASRQTMISLPSFPEENLTYRIQFEKIFHQLLSMHYPEEISPRIWEQVNSFHRFQRYLDGNNGDPEVKSFVSVGLGLSEFLKDVSMNTISWRFQQVLVLFMLLLQYALDQSNQGEMIDESPVDCLVQYMNPFINWHIGDYSELIGIGHLWVMRSQNMHQLFLCFYNWLKWRKYTNFCITLID